MFFIELVDPLRETDIYHCFCPCCAFSTILCQMERLVLSNPTDSYLNAFLNIRVYVTTRKHILQLSSVVDNLGLPYYHGGWN